MRFCWCEGRRRWIENFFISALHISELLHRGAEARRKLHEQSSGPWRHAEHLRHRLPSSASQCQDATYTEEEWRYRQHRLSQRVESGSFTTTTKARPSQGSRAGQWGLVSDSCQAMMRTGASASQPIGTITSQVVLRSVIAIDRYCIDESRPDRHDPFFLDLDASLTVEGTEIVKCRPIGRLVAEKS